MSVRLLMRAWLRQASSFRRLSLCCSIILFSSSIVFRLHSIDEICFRVQREKNIVKLSEQRSQDGVHKNQLVRVNIYLGLELHHVCFYLHIGFIQFLYFMIQMLNILFVFNTWVTTDLFYYVQTINTGVFLWNQPCKCRKLERYHTTQHVRVAYHCWPSVW